MLNLVSRGITGMFLLGYNVVKGVISSKLFQVIFKTIFQVQMMGRHNSRWDKCDKND
jgi:hypothetical protein